MKTPLKKEAGIIEVADDFASLESIEDGKCTYKITYSADPVRAVQTGAITVKIHVSENPYIKKMQPALSVPSSVDIIKNLLLKSPMQKDIARSAKSDYILTYISDISSRIPNDMTQRLASAKFGQAVPLRVNKKVSTRTVSELNDANVNLPILDSNLNKASAEEAATTDKRIKSHSQRLIHDHGKDPASVVGQKTNTVSTAKKSVAGTSNKLTYDQTRDVKNLPFIKGLIAPLLSKNDYTNQQQVSDSEHINVLVEETVTTIEISEFIEIPTIALSKPEFYFIFQLFNSKGLEITTISKLVNHNHNVQLLQIPTVPPVVSVRSVNVPGRAVFEIKQKDRNAKGVLIYRHATKTALSNTDAVFTLVNKLNLTAREPAQKLEDRVSGVAPILYRFIPFTDENVPASVFSSAVVQFKPQAKIDKRRKKLHFVTLTSEIKTNCISIEVKDLPADVIAFKLIKRDLSIHQKDFEIVGNAIQFVSTQTSVPFIIEDQSVKQNRIYEYRVLLISRDGTEETGSNNIVVEYTPVISNIVNTTTTQPEIVNKNNELDVVFNVNYSVNFQSSELVKKFLTDQGLLAEFQDQISEERDKLNRLFAYGVERMNLTTGELENFGVISSQNFSDRKFGSVKSIKPLEPGDEYRYIITTYFRNPETLFSTITREVTTANGTYTLQPYKWLQPVTLNEGNLVSDSALRRNHAKDIFKQGQVANIQTINVSLSNVLPNITDAQVTKIRRNATLIQWKVDGNIKKIDHFLIVLESLGMRTIIGAAHNITNSNSFQFVDTLTSGESGALTYFIVPVYYDYSRGTQLKTNTVVI